MWSRVLDNEKRRWEKVTDHGNELPGENAGCHKARQDKKWRNRKKSKPTRDSSRSDKKETSHVVWPRIKNVRGQTANQSTTLLYSSRGRPCKKWINNIQEDLNHLQLNMKEVMDIVRDRQEWRHRISTSSSPLGWRANKKKLETAQDRR